MAEKQSERWSDYRPTKAVWFWSCAACIVLTMIVGFTLGGWVTGGTARERVATAEEAAIAEFAATICEYRFLHAPDAGTQLAALKEADSWDREDLIEEGGWVTLTAFEEPFDEAAELCADHLAEAELPEIAAVETDAAMTNEATND